MAGGGGDGADVATGREMPPRSRNRLGLPVGGTGQELPPGGISSPAPGGGWRNPRFIAMEPDGATAPPSTGHFIRIRVLMLPTDQGSAGSQRRAVPFSAEVRRPRVSISSKP